MFTGIFAAELLVKNAVTPDSRKQRHASGYAFLFRITVASSGSTIMALSVANTMGVSVDLPTALMLSLMATLGACGASGVAGGSLLLIPMACSLFGIPQDISMQAVAVGMIIGVVQDSLETAINSSGDVLFAATTEYHQWQKEGLLTRPLYLQRKVPLS